MKLTISQLSSDMATEGTDCEKEAGAGGGESGSCLPPFGSCQKHQPMPAVILLMTGGVRVVCLDKVPVESPDPFWL